MPIRAILFDLGNTLIRPIHPWEEVTPQAIADLGAALQAHLPELDSHLFARRFQHALSHYYGSRDNALREPGMDTVLQTALETPCPPPEIRHQALRAFYRRTQANWTPVKNVHATLDALRQQGLRLAVLSNAADDADVQTLVQQAGLRSFMDFVLTSAVCGWRKPHPQAFQLALKHWPFPPAEVLMVGDRLEADIRGANLAGLPSVWVTGWAENTRPDPAAHPDYQIEQLSQLPELLAQM